MSARETVKKEKKRDSYPLTDAGNAERFRDDWGDNLRWVPDWNSWVWYGGQRWAKVSPVELIRLAIKTARQFDSTVISESDDDRRKLLRKHARGMEDARALNAMIALARTFLVEESTSFDRDPNVLAVANGTIDLATGTFREHRREDFITRCAPVDFDPAAPCPVWDRFVATVLPSDSTRGWLQRFLGYSLGGSVGEQCLAFLYGSGANGKSTLLETVLAILGPIAKPGAPDLLLAKHGEAHPTELADLQGARLVICQETEAGRQWAEALVKRLTGGDRIKARWMRADFFEFEPTHKLIVSANHRPKVRGQDEGIWRRIRLVPFVVTIPAEERDGDLPAKLRAESSGILNWLLAGHAAWRAGGLGTDRAIEDATRAYRRDQDVLAHFVEDVCTVESGAFVDHGSLYIAYSDWCGRTGHLTWKRETFLDGLEERGYERGRTKKARGIFGLSIAQAER